MKKSIFQNFLQGGTILAVLFSAVFQPQASVHAAASLSIEAITWNVIGLDSNNVNVGPNNFPVGARVCNTGDLTASNVKSAFVFDDLNDLYTGDTYINLRAGSLSSYTDNGVNLAPGECKDFYYEVTVTRNDQAYDKFRNYHITAGIGATTGVSTPLTRQLYVEHLISQNRNSTNLVCYAPGTDPMISPCSVPAQEVGVGGNLNLSVGNTYVIELQASTATQGYNQLEDFINFPNTIFQVLDVYSKYSADSSGYVSNSSDKLYADACLWDMDPNSTEYLSCIGSDGKVGGTISTAYVVKILAGAGTSEPLNTLIYDYSGSSFHYNSDFSSSVRYAVISSPLTVTKSFSSTSISTTGFTTLSLAVKNTSATEVTGASLTDTFPTTPSQMKVYTTPNASISGTGCSGSFDPAPPAAGDTSVSVTNLTVPANSICTIKVDVTTNSSLGTYVNTTGNVFINGADTGNNASANLTVESMPAGGACTPTTIANWTISGATVPPAVTTTDTGVTAVASTNATSSISGSDWRITNASVNSGNTAAINITTDVYYLFQVTTTGYTDVKMNFGYIRGAAGAQKLEVHYGNSATISGTAPVNPVLLSGAQFTPTTTLQTASNLDFTNKTNTNGNTYFFIYVANQSNSGGTAWVGIRDITFTGCRPTQTISKAFATDPIAAGGTSRLTFTLSNADSLAANNTSFTDVLPTGMTIATAPNTANTCGGTLIAAAETSTISLTGATIPANSSCTVSVDITSAESGTLTNISGYLTSKNVVINSQATDTLTVLDPPSISKSFSPNTIYAGEASTLTFTLRNPNAATGLTGVGFTDLIPADITASATVTNTCGGTATSALDGVETTRWRVSLSGGSIAAGESCTITVSTSSNKTGTYTNTTGAVTSTNGGTGNTASANLVVQSVHPGIGLVKEISDSPTGPWAQNVNVASGATVYYRITVENTGDVPLTNLNVTDTNPSINLSGCTWPAVLPVGTATISPTASCIFPRSNVTSNDSNTATVTGTYNGTVYTSSPDTATFGITSLELVKSLASINSNPLTTSFSAAGNIVTYNYVVTNKGPDLTGTLTITDSNTTVTVDGTSCPGWTGTLTQNSSITCSASYVVTAFDMSVGSVTNTAYAKIGATRSNSDRVTVFATNPDLIVAKNNNAIPYALVGTPFNWEIQVSNQGPLPATFDVGQTILSDQLPASGATYGTPTVGAVTGISNPGNINCNISSGLLTCTVITSAVTIPGSTGSFTVTVSTTPTSAGSLSNPLARVDPSGVVTESDEGNNSTGDAVTVNANANLGITKTDSVAGVAPGVTVTYTVVVSNAGPSAADGTKFVDPAVANLTVSSVTCGTPTGSAACPSVENTTVTLMQGTGIAIPTMPSGGSVTFTVTGTAGAAGNTIVNSSYVVAPSGIIDPTPANNSATDTDQINPLADLSVTKTNSATSVGSGSSTTYTLTVTNNGPSAANGATLQDAVVTGLNKTSIGTCAPSGSAVCPTAGAGANNLNISNLENGTVVIPTLPSGGSISFTVTASVGAISGTVANTLTATPPSGVTDPTPATATDTDNVILPAATIAVSPASVTEDGATDLVYTVTLDQAPAVNTTINLTLSGTATDTTDFTGAVASVTINAGSTTGTITINPTTDTTVEGNETVIFTIATGTGYTIGTPSSATGTITDDDVPVATIAVNPSSVLEDGATDLVYTVTLDQAPLVNTTVNVGLSGTATTVTDFTGSVASVTINAGQTTGTITINPATDTAVEGDETVILTIQSGTGYTIGTPASATGNITDNDLPVATIAVNPTSVLEDGATDLVYTVTLDQAPVVNTTVNVGLTGTATDTTDFTGTAASVTINAGLTTGTITINPVIDTAVEGDETVIFTIQSGTGYTIGTPASATGTITDDEVPVATISINPASVAEDGVTDLVYTVTLDRAPAANVTINVGLSGTATNTNDFTGSVASLTILSGQTTGTITINPATDTIVEGDETVIFTIQSGTGYAIGATSSATGTITDNDLPVATIAVNPTSVLEDGATDLVYTVTLDQAPVVNTTVNVGLSGTATTVTDFTGSVASVTINAGQTTGTITINPATDNTVEGDETVIFTIQSGTGYTIGTPSAATGTITDNDLPVATIAVNPTSVLEDGATDLVYTVTLDQAPVVNTTVNVGLSGTATNTTDFTGTAASVTINAGLTTGTITINPVIDTAVEGDETVIFTIQSGTGYTIGTPASATGTITDDDLPVATIAVSPASVTEDGVTDLVYTITLDQAPLVNTTVNVGLTGTATSTADFTGSVASVTINAGQTTGTITINPATDTTVEGAETVIFTIAAGTGYTIGNPASATGTITDNDLPVATIAVSPVSVTEDGATDLVYTITLDQAPVVNTTINLGLSGTATTVTDFTGSVASVTINAGSTTGTITINPATDATVEGDETVIFTIQSGTGYTIGTPSAATGTITDDDSTNVFDPPSGFKTFNDAGMPEMVYQMVWINSGNAAAINVQVTDDIPTGTMYIAGSLVCEPRGSSSNAVAATAPLNTGISNSFCAFDPIANRVQWQGNIGPDDGNMTELAADNEVVITFRVSVDASVSTVNNIAVARTDTNGDNNFQDDVELIASSSSSNEVVWERSISEAQGLPKTGFKPGAITSLSQQPIEKSYAGTDLMLEIPSLKVSLPIVGVPMVAKEWDVSWLAQQAGWLNGTAFPGWSGNSALTGHVVLPNGQPGPFEKLGSLKWGDRILIHSYGSLYTYEVRENRTVRPWDTSILSHEEEPWVTLLTCKTYNERTDTYSSRVAVRAVLIKVEKDPLGSTLQPRGR